MSESEKIFFTDINFDYEEIRTSKIKCGEIFYEHQQILFQCAFCELQLKADNISLIEHLENHLKNDNVNNISPIIEHIKSEAPDDINFFLENEIQDENNSASNELCPKNKLIKTESNLEESNQMKKSPENKTHRDIILPNIEIASDNFYHCPYAGCTRSTLNPKLIRMHIRNFHILEPKPLFNSEKLQCPQCDFTFKLKRNLLRHLYLVHGTLSSVEINISKKDKKFHCPECDGAWSRLYKLNSHMRIEHEDFFNELLDSQQNNKNSKLLISKPIKVRVGSKPKKDIEIGEDGLWQCPFCDVRKPPNKLRIEDHLTQKHRNNRICEICGKELSSYNSLKRHRLTHTGEKPYKCLYCDKSFADQTNCTNHIRIHTGDKRYKCCYCDKRFIQSTEKKLHELTQHIKEKGIQCEICGKSFYLTTKLKTHMRRHTGEKPYSCKICGKKFYENDYLKDHMLSHTNIRAFECEICGSKFLRKRNLVAHKLTHSSIKKYHCEICNQSFAQNAGLYSHRKTHHKDIIFPNMNIKE